MLIGVLFLTVLSAISLKNLSFNYDFERFFPQEDPDLDYYLKHRETFASDNDFLLIALGAKQSIFSVDFLKSIDTLHKSLHKLEDVESVFSPTQAFRLIQGPFGPVKVKYIHPNTPERFKEDSLQLQNEKHLIGSFFSKELDAVLLMVQHTPYLSKIRSDKLLTSIEAEVNRFSFHKVYYSGKIHGQFYFIKKIQGQMAIFMTTSLLLVILFLFLSFRHVFAIVIPLCIVLISLCWTLSLMQLNGEAIDVIATLLPTILFVVGISDAVHFLTRYADVLKQDNTLSILDALKITIKDVGWATLLTSLTTAMGFASLMSAQILPVKAFGLYTAIGVCLAFMITYVLLPPLIYIYQIKFSTMSLNQKGIIEGLDRLFLYVFRHPKLVFLCFGGMLLLSILGIGKIEVNNFLLEDLKENDPLMKGYSYIEEAFCGARPFELALHFNSDPLEQSNLLPLEQLHQYLTKDYGVKALVSPLVFLKQIHRSTHGGGLNQEKIPSKVSEREKLLAILKKQQKRLGLSQFLDAEHNVLRLVGKTADFGGKHTDQKDLQLTKFIKELFKDKVTEVHPTGMAKLIDKNNTYLVQNMVLGLSISFVLVSVLMAFLYRSFKMVFIALLANVLPLIFIAGCIGWMGMYLNVSISIIFTIAFGIAVDDTIHFLAKFKSAVNKTDNILLALKQTYRTTGKAIVVTSLILLGGFLTLVLASFNSIMNIGILVSLTLFLAVLVDLTLLPLLLYLGYRNRETPSV